MKFARRDLKQLGLPLAVCIALILASVACYFFSDNYLQETKRQAVATAAQRTEVQGRLSSANEEEREIKASLQQYQALAARGIVGDEKRLDWVDTVTAIKNERRLPLDLQRRIDVICAGGQLNHLVARTQVQGGLDCRGGRRGWQGGVNGCPLGNPSSNTRIPVNPAIR